MQVRQRLGFQASAALVGLLLASYGSAGEESPGRLLRFQHAKGEVASYDFSASGRGLRQDTPVEFTEKVKCRVEFEGEQEQMQQLRARFVSGSYTATAEDQKKKGAVSPMVSLVRMEPTGSISSFKTVSGESTQIPFFALGASPDDVGFVLDLPAEPVKKGSSWQGQEKGSAADQAEAVRVDYTVLGEETIKGRPCLRIKSVSSGEFAEEVAGPTPQSMAHVKVNWSKTKLFFFDYERGLVMASTNNERIHALVSLEDPTAGQLTDEISTVINSKTTLTEFKPRGGR